MAARSQSLFSANVFRFSDALTGSSPVRYSSAIASDLLKNSLGGLDKDGIAIIMCEPQLVSKYQALTQGKTVLESSLHHNMLEHLNSEIALGTITNLQSAKSWLHNSFLYQRLRKNPSHYALHQDTSKNWHERLEDIVLQNVGRLEATQLVCRTEDDQIQPTDYGDIMSKVVSSPSPEFHVFTLPCS